MHKMSPIANNDIGDIAIDEEIITLPESGMKVCKT